MRVVSSALEQEQEQELGQEQGHGKVQVPASQPHRSGCDASPRSWPALTCRVASGYVSFSLGGVISIKV